VLVTTQEEAPVREFVLEEAEMVTIQEEKIGASTGIWK
jgi:hypothetical protein